MSRVRAGAAILWLVSLPLIGTLTACGSGSGGQLRVALSGDPQATYKPGDQAKLTIVVTNAGPGAVNGVTVHVTLPSGFRYRSTEVYVAPGTQGSTRTQPLDADVNSQTPIWGVWNLGAPGTAGPGVASTVTVQFEVEVEGQPGKALVSAYAVGDEASGQSNASPIAVVVAPAAKLSADVSVNPGTIKSGGTVQYTVRVTNTGTDAAQVGVLVTLPPSLTFTGSVMPFAGNAARNGVTTPIKNTLEVYYDGFTLPADSSGGPGYLVIQFKAAVSSAAQAGTFAVTCSITDAKGDTFSLPSAAPLTITPGAGATPGGGFPSPRASPSPTH